ncbi:hypothetical protein C2G38_2235768 [Gigaspora rosea]|uniref:O-methyltransferase domain-containing protein n=1 Tax=Gigaspora rosea TaxID=44941 RepID=A0A397TQ18_9GLOM|nr:hypothetical protein C2G38_2235768 [Gigaspora rosea]
MNGVLNELPKVIEMSEQTSYNNVHDYIYPYVFEVRSAIHLTNASSETTSYFKPKLLIADRVTDDPTQSYIYQLDLKVMCLLNGKERTKSEMEKILDKSGWKFMKITSCRGGFSVIEAVPL